MTEKKNIFIVIAVFNRKSFTKDCLLSIKKQTYKNYQIVIVDDGSTDGTGEMLEEEFPEVFIIKGDGNLWWTAATNRGIKYSMSNGADYILTLNNDTLLAEDFLEKMIYWAEKKSNSLLGAFALKADTMKPIYGGEIINWKYANSRYLLNTLSEDKYNGVHEVTHFPGRGLLIPGEVLNNIGYFDERHFPHYLADYDFTHRALKAGYKIYCNYDSKIFIYLDESGDYQNRMQKSWKSYYRHILGIKGGGNIKIFFWYAIKNCPPKYLFLFLPIGFIRRTLGYLLDWIRQRNIHTLEKANHHSMNN